jgi:hypothetical protein
VLSSVSQCRLAALPRAVRRALPGALLGLALLSGAPPPGQAAAPPAAIARYFAATGKTLAPEFTAYYDAHGGLAVFGYPIEDAHSEGGFLVQLCERERLEYHPENRGTPYEVLLGRLGADLTTGRADSAFAPAPSGAPAAGVYVPQTRQRLGGPFLDYWQAHGAVAMFGYPISQEFVENGLRQQWFERARFEFHPELPAAFRVTLGLLGRELAAQRAEPVTDVRVSAGPAAPRRLQLGLAQGGESRDPAFLHNVVPLIGALHVPLIRLDNIYTSYHVVDRDPAGALRFSWTELDAVVDDIRAMGAQPLLCLSYTPPALSPDGSPIQPPTSLVEWRRLVEATVTHFNRDRALGLQYWEVWNEPDQWDFWRGSWPGYLDLYDVTRQAVLSVDPQARVGGPARAAYDAGAFGWLLSHEQQLGAAGGLDFLSWHVYGLSPATVADQIGTARNLLAGRPGPAPELAITEFNVLPGGANDTSSDHQSDSSAGAAYVLSLLERMERAGLDRAFLFEVKDGYSPSGSYWGRWGLTTFDGRTKPVYHALKAFQELGPALLPAEVTGAPGVGALAAAPNGTPSLIVWNTGASAARTRISLPPEWAGRAFDLTLFDAMHNNPQATGDDRVTPLGRRDGGGLIFDLAPGSVLLLHAP